jgi:subtilisin family serine protease
MNRKSLNTLLSLIVLASLLVLPFTSLKAAPVSAAPEAPDVWYGTWQMGPGLDATILGCPAGNGVARITGVYYQPQNRVYFLGARCEDNNTYGTVYYFDLASRTYAVTGAVMPVPVSNYSVVTVPNDGAGNGPGLYIVGGRENSGAQTAAVQVYYPNTNTVATIATDPFPPAVLYSPGGVAYAGGKIYVFGGFDGTNMYATTWAYDPAAAAGSRWSNTGEDLPTARSYISAIAVGNLIYAIGGDELPALTPIVDTVVLDATNVAAGWNDVAMADLPIVNGDAPAVYVNEGYLGGTGGGIFVIGGGWPAPGPYRYVYRYDIATDTWEDFPQLVIPAPATGRRNQAAVYVPNLTEGLGDGVPGIWTFGGYDGSGTNAMTETSEFFSIEVNSVLVLPDALQASGFPGDTVTHGFVVLNETGSSDTFDLSFTSDVTWDVTLPATVGPVANGTAAPFNMEVTIPADVTCDTTGTFNVTATSQANPLLSDTQEVTVYAICSLVGVVTDATTGAPIEGAFVWIWNTVGGTDTAGNFFGYTDATGAYALTNSGQGIPPDSYYMGASAAYHQPSFYPDGWPDGAIMIDIGGQAGVQDVALVSSELSISPGSFEATLDPGSSVTQTLTLTNTGTGPVSFFLSTVDGTQVDPPPAAVTDMPVPGLPRVDPQIAADLAASPDGTAEFLVVLKSQADLRAAYAMQDWQARGLYVFNTLSQHAARTQVGLRSALTNAGVSYTPLYIINAVIVRNGDQNLVDSLSARPDVAQIVANRRIEVEKPIPADPLAPEAIEWNITKIKAPGVWAAYTEGEGAVVAEIDTGTQWDHPALKNQYRGWDGVTADHNYNWFDPYGQSPAAPSDTEGHGTHVMGTMVGDDGAANQIGVAPGAKWISCKGGDNVSGYLLTNELLQCAQWIVAPTDLSGANPDPSKRPDVVNNSWGGDPGDYWFTGAVDAWRAAGIFPQFANGNAGPNCSTAHAPGDNWNTFSAGASDSADAIASFSSRGPAQFYGFLKPDITAPGANIRSSLPTALDPDGYGPLSGTSMASPHVAASIALLWAANPELKGQIDLSGWLLQQTAVPKTTTETCGGIPAGEVPNNTFGYGLLDIYAAVSKAQAGGVTTEWLSVSPMAGELLPGETAQVDVGFHPTLTMSGTYTGTLWLVADDPVNNDVRLPVTLNVNAPEPPVVSFTTNSPVHLGDPVEFTNTTTGSEPIDYLWDFGDGITSMLTSPSHLYEMTGTFTVTLTASNFFGDASLSQAVEVLAPILPTAEFESNSPVLLGETAVFTNTSTGSGALSFEWDFGDDVTSTLESPTHVFATAGTFQVTLTVTSPFGSDDVMHPFVVREDVFMIFLPMVPQVFTPE